LSIENRGCTGIVPGDPGIASIHGGATGSYTASFTTVLSEAM
jgi:hypothetical protein